MKSMPFKCWAGLFVLGISAGAASAATRPQLHEAPRRMNSSRQPLPWYVTTGAIHRMSLKKSSKFHRFEHLSLDATEAESQLHALKDAGINAIEVFAPEEGGNSYNGLDAKNHYALDPGTGSIKDFRRLVQTRLTRSQCPS